MHADPPEPSADPSPELDQLVFQYLEQSELDRDSRIVLEELCAAHPERADDLRDAISALRETGLIEEEGGSDSFPEHLGEFRLLRRLGGGGMGIVYLAEQTSLGRPVALKLIRGELLYFGGARARFQREVEAVSRLAHPNIVPVYTVGEERGIPYCAMEYVEGCSLDEVLRAVPARAPDGLTGRDARGAMAAACSRRGDPAPAEWNDDFFRGTWVDFCLRVTREVAGALAHAHERGVLHRDVKPSNVMITPTGRVLLVDFGLASLQGTDSLTRTGSMLGSLPYMAPEQIEGRLEDVGPRTDVYGLGVTLCELLTLRPPYFSESAELTRQLVLEARTPSLRQRNSSLSEEVETVCLCAMDRDPTRRYADPAAFARDLANVLERRPIAARPAGPVLRLRRWAERRPAVAVAFVLGVLLLTVAPLAWGINRSWAMGEVRAAYDREKEERESAERHLARALEAIHFSLHQMGKKGLENVPQMQLVRLETIDKALELIAEMVAERPVDLELRRESARLHRSRADVLQDLGRLDEACREYRLHIEFYEELVEHPESRLADHWQLAGCIQQLGTTLFTFRRMDESLAAYGDAAARMRRVVELGPEQPQYRLDLSIILSNHGGVLLALSRFREAEDALLEARDLAAGVLAVRPGDPECRFQLSRCHGNLGLLASVRAEGEEALEQYERSAELLAGLHTEYPDDRNYASDLALRQNFVASRLNFLGRSAEALEMAQRSLALFRELTVSYPEVLEHKTGLADSLSTLSLVYVTLGRYEEALEVFEDVVQRATELADDHPDWLGHAVDAALLLDNLANFVIFQIEDYERAAGIAEHAIEMLERGPTSDPGDGHYARVMARAYYFRALAHCLGDDMEAATPRVEEYEALPFLDATGLRQAADLWNEWVLAVRRNEPDAALRDEMERYGKERMYYFLNLAVENGFADVDELAATDALDPFRGEPEFRAVLAAIAADAK